VRGTHAIIRGGMYCNGWDRPGRVRESLQLGGVRLLRPNFGEVPSLSGWLGATGVLCEMNVDA
jgi:hypothetical protein